MPFSVTLPVVVMMVSMAFGVGLAWVRSSAVPNVALGKF